MANEFQKGRFTKWLLGSFFIYIVMIAICFGSVFLVGNSHFFGYLIVLGYLFLFSPVIAQIIGIIWGIRTLMKGDKEKGLGLLLGAIAPFVIALGLVGLCFAIILGVN
ncbi:MAG: hypothetical protein ACI8Y7_000386 [Candidatus Woesearchaeota archaeon]|jgi:hypothetical protein